VGCHQGIVLELRENLVCQLFSKFHTPLVITKEVPNDSLHKDFVFIHSDETSQGTWGDFFYEDRVCGLVSLENTIGKKKFNLFLAFSCCLHFRNDFFLGFSVHQSLCLSEEVGKQEFMMIADGVVCLGGSDEITGDKFCSLMNQLIEGMLTVGAWFSPDDGTCLVGDRFATAINALAIAFHVSLLEVCWEAMEILVVGENGMGFCTKEVVVPDTEQGKDDGYIFSEGGFTEMLIHSVSPLKEFAEVFKTNGAGYREADGRPKRVSPTDPVPELKHVLGVNAEFLYFFFVGGNGNEVLFDILFLGAFQKPFPCTVSICHGFLGGECLGGNEKEGCLGIEFLECFSDVRTINIGNKVRGDVRLFVGAKSLCNHNRTEVRTTDADIYNIGDGFSSVSLPFS